jgi:hypothetical protein
MAQTKIKNADPLKTRNGNTRLGPLGWEQLEEAVTKEQKAKLRQKLRHRMSWIQKNRPDMVKIKPVETVAEEAAE